MAETNWQSNSGAVVWLTGLPSAGKSTLAERIRFALMQAPTACCVLDSDRVRVALGGVYAYDEAGRDAFYETLARLAALLADQGLVVLVPATAPRVRYRDRAREMMAAHGVSFFEVFVDVAPAECVRRDAKGLYAHAAAGKVSNVPGVDVAYERPTAPDVVARGGDDDAAIRQVLARLGNRGRLLAIDPREA